MKTINEIYVLWRNEKAQQVKPSSMATYAMLAEKHILPAFGRRRSISSSDAQAFAAQKLGSGLSQRTVKDVFVVLGMIVRYGERRGLCRHAAWHVDYPRPKAGGAPLPILRQEEQRVLMDHLLSHITLSNLGIYICLTTGLRIGEICALRWQDFNLPARTLTVNRTIGRICNRHDGSARGTRLLIGPPKTPMSVREIPLSARVAAIVGPLAAVSCPANYVLTNSPHPTEPRTYRSYFYRLMNALGLPHMKFHGLRHTFATRCIESQCDYKTVSALLGHANINTTLNLYVHPNMEQKRRAIGRMLERLEP